MPHAFAQETAAKCISGRTAETQTAEEGLTREQGDAILLELQQIRRLLEQPQHTRLAASPAPVSPTSIRMKVETDWHIMGKPNAPITIVEFTDIQCPFCRRFETEIFPELKRDYIDTGKVRFISRDLPLPFHPYAMQAAEASRCADDQKKFWEFRDAVLVSSDLPTRETILTSAETIGIDLRAFRVCLDSEKYKSQVEADANAADALQIHGTPTFVIAETDEHELDGTRLVGARSYSAFQSTIDQMISKHSGL
jgi:protein-disulfide isomerase